MTTTEDKPGSGTSRKRSPLHNVSLTRKEGWAEFVNHDDDEMPDNLSRRQINALSSKALRAYNNARLDWHANLGPFETPQYLAAHEWLDTIVDTSRQKGDKLKGSAAIDSPPGLGKTTIAQHYAKKVHRAEIAEYGDRTDEGHERLPVCWVPLSGNPTLREFNIATLTFFAHPGATTSRSGKPYLQRAVDCLLLCETKLLVIDDLHFLKFPSKSGREVSDHFKYLAGASRATLLYVGVGLSSSRLMEDDKASAGVKAAPAATGFLTEGQPTDGMAAAQILRRTTTRSLGPFGYRVRAERDEWVELLKTIELRLVLANNGRGMLADELPDYLFERSTGHIGSLMTLINRGCFHAIRSGAEELTKAVLEEVQIDAGAEAARSETAAKIRHWRGRTGH
jgi:hypothetical protein